MENWLFTNAIEAVATIEAFFYNLRRDAMLGKLGTDAMVEYVGLWPQALTEVSDSYSLVTRLQYLIDCGQ